MSHAYDDKFMKYASSSSEYSARIIVDELCRMISPPSVLDVGCAAGTWLRAWKQADVKDYCGIDGDYVDRQQMQIESQRFRPHDLSLAFDLGRKFSLVQSLEVGEHIPPKSAGVFVQSIVRHAENVVMFSAAPPG